MSNYTKTKRITLKNHPTYSENWVQEIIAADPSVLGLGDLVFRDRERRQRGAGRLDLLLQDRDGRRYELELQLGPTDPSHIIRSIEYWDYERKLYPQYEHCAVLVAEDITSRFLNVVSLFNGSLPVIALQMQALEVGEHVTLVFTKVLDELRRGVVDEDEDAMSAPTDRSYWEGKASRKSIAVMDGLFELVRESDPDSELKYNKFYVGLAKDGRANNYVIFRPQKASVVFEAWLPRSDDVDTMLDATEMETSEYHENYKIRVRKADLTEKNKDLFRHLIKEAQSLRGN